MLFMPPLTIKDKVAGLRWHLPGMNLHKFLKGMPTALARSRETVPRGLNELRKVRRVGAIANPRFGFRNHVRKALGMHVAVQLSVPC